MNLIGGAWFACLVALVGCRGTLVLRPVKFEVVEATPQAWEPVVGPDHWVHFSGLEVTIPEGWRGATQDDPALELQHTDGKVSVRIVEAASLMLDVSTWSMLRERHSCERFAGVDACTTWTEVQVGGKGSVREVWLLELPAGAYALEVVYPFGGVVSGTALAGELLDGVGLTQTDVRWPDSGRKRIE